MHETSRPNAESGQADSVTTPIESSAYRTAVADLDVDGNTIIALWRTGLNQGGFPEAKLKWYYRDNAQGNPLVLLLYHTHSQDAVGVAAVGPRRMKFGSETLMAGLLADFVTRPEHRNFFPAIYLQREIRRRAFDSFIILFGFPNAKASPVVKRAGYVCVGQMTRRIRVLRSASYLATFLPVWASGMLGAGVDAIRSTAMRMRGRGKAAFHSRWQERPDSSFDDLWSRIAISGVLMGVRDSTFLNWRFVDAPGKSFRFFTLISSAGQRLAAYAVCSADGDVLRVEDFLVDSGYPRAGIHLWAELTREARRMGHASLCVEFLGPEQDERQLGAAGFMIREGRPVYASVTQPDGPNAISTIPSNWYLTSADEDL